MASFFIVITFFLFTKLPRPVERKGHFGLLVKLPPAYLSTTNDGGLTLSLLMLNVKQGRCGCQIFYVTQSSVANQFRSLPQILPKSPGINPSGKIILKSMRKSLESEIQHAFFRRIAIFLQSNQESKLNS